MPKPIRLHVCGLYALFSRPELKSERYTYDIITPSAARGIMDAIYYHPGMKWCIDRIYVQNPIRFINIRRNEVSVKIRATDLLSAANGSEKQLYINRAESIQQRAATVLRDVSYIIEAHFELVPKKMNVTDNEDKFFAIFSNRLKSGKCANQPYFGCREFTASFEPYTDTCEPETIRENRDLGLMLYDMDYENPDGIKPMFFRAVMTNGIVDVSGSEVIK